MRHLIFFCACLMIVTPAIAAGKNRAPATVAAVKAIKDYCYAAVKENKDIATFAAQKGLIEFPEEQARKFAPDGGRVFSIPSASGNAVLMTNKKFPSSVCAIAMHEISVKALWESLDEYFNGTEGFAMMREKRVDEDRITKREYGGGKDNEEFILLVTASDAPRPSGMQALATFARPKTAP